MLKDFPDRKKSSSQSNIIYPSLPWNRVDLTSCLRASIRRSHLTCRRITNRAIKASMARPSVQEEYWRIIGFLELSLYLHIGV